MAEVPEISVNSTMETSMIELDDSEVDFGGSTLQKKQRDIRIQLKKNPELNSKTLSNFLSNFYVEQYFSCIVFEITF